MVYPYFIGTHIVQKRVIYFFHTELQSVMIFSKKVKENLMLFYSLVTFY